MINFETISPKKNKPQPSSKKISSQQEGLTRRDVLKGLTATTILAIAGPKIRTLTKKDVPSFSEKDQKKLDATIAKLIHKFETTKAQQEIEEKDISIIGKTFAQQIEMNEEIRLDQITRNTIYKHHYEQYKPGGLNYEKNIINGLNRMRKWIVEIQKIFSKYNIDEKFIYLAIAESGFRTKAVSPDAAIGPYQITSKTALNYELLITKTYDERLDPIRSAELCAIHLKDGLKISDNNEPFALMDYNGGYTKQYILDVINNEKKLSKKEIEPQKDMEGNILIYTLSKNDTLENIAKKFNTSVTRLKIINDIKDFEVRKLRPGKKLIIPEGRKITFEKFNTWLEHKINTIIKEYETIYTYIVRPGDTLSTIAEKFHENYHEIMALNNLQNDDIKIGQKLRIPYLEQKRKERVLEILSDYRENINYPSKFYAIFDIIKQNKLLNRFHNATIDYYEIKPPSEKLQTFNYTIQNGDTLLHIAYILKKNYPQCVLTRQKLVSMFIEQNKNISNTHKLITGKSINLQFPLKLPGTLIDIARENNIDISILQNLNPAVLDEFASLPKNARIRIPKK